MLNIVARLTFFFLNQWYFCIGKSKQKYLTINERNRIMQAQKSNKSLIGTGILTAIAASLCCITPVLAVLGGVSGFASAFSWLDPLRPYLIGVTVLVLGFAWYQKLKPVQEIDCDCDEDVQPSFWQGKTFLAIVTVITALLLAFPYYSGVFFPNNTKTIIIQEHNIANANLSIEGMTCTGCENSVTYALNEQKGVIEAISSYKEGSANVKFDTSKVSVADLSKAITDATGYEVTGHQLIENK